ncbi:hypothetical protein [Legionella israelensis]|uniref:hypothetical protein n=1 Tax=Legionella israelensis TaxID=454 RepID=UPI001FD7A6A8|nr:hypothetical protein [Legionella israelensis]
MAALTSLSRTCRNDFSHVLAGLEKRLSMADFRSPELATIKKYNYTGLIKYLSLATFAIDWQAREILASRLPAIKGTGCLPYW